MDNVKKILFQFNLTEYQIELIKNLILKDMKKNQLCIESYGAFRNNDDCKILINNWKAENDIISQLNNKEIK